MAIITWLNYSWLLDYITVSWLNVSVTTDCDTPKRYFNPLKENPWAKLHIVKGSCLWSSIGSYTIAVGCLRVIGLTDASIHSKFCRFILKLSLNSLSL